MGHVRAGAVETMAKSRYDRMVDRMVKAAHPKLMLLPDWGELDADDKAAQLEAAESYLDALLDYLEANANEWWEVAKANPRFKDGGPTMERRLLSVLREDAG